MPPRTVTLSDSARATVQRHLDAAEPDLISVFDEVRRAGGTYAIFKVKRHSNSTEEVQVLLAAGTMQIERA